MTDKPRKVPGAYINLGDGSVFKDPAAIGELEWRLRYGRQHHSEISREDELACASILSAYRYLLIECTQARMCEVRRVVRQVLEDDNV